MNSPFIGQGNDSYVDGTLFSSIEYDFFGNPRVNDIVDMGAVEYVNYRPVLTTSNDLTLESIEEDEDDSSGTSISTLVSGFGGLIIDKNFDSAEGIAVVAVDNSKGSVEYSTNDGNDWTAVVEVSDNNALLLPAVSSNKIRFVPKENFHGTASSVVSFRAWGYN